MPSLLPLRAISALLVATSVPNSYGHARLYDIGIGSPTEIPSWLASINDRGQMAGQSAFGGGDEPEFHSAIFDLVTVTDLGPSGPGSSLAEDINNTGLVVGWAPLGNNWGYRAVLYNPDGMTNLGTLGGSYSWAMGINDAGTVVGTSALSGDTASRAFVFENGVMSALDTLGGSHSSATDINNSGLIVGASTTSIKEELHAFLFDGNAMRDLGTLGGNMSSAESINDHGQVVGNSAIHGNQYYHAFATFDGVMRDLGTLGGNYSVAFGNNNAGDVVGHSQRGDSSNAAFLYRDGMMHDLNTLYSDLLGNGNTPGFLKLVEAVDINNAGDIIGTGWYTDGTNTFVKQFLLRTEPPSTVPEDVSSLLLTFTGLTLIVGLRTLERTRRRATD